MKLFYPMAVLTLMCTPVRADLIGAWSLNELAGDIFDATGGHAPGTLAPLGSVDYGQPGVPNGVYGAITVSGAAGTSIGFGPNLSDDYFISGNNNINPAMNIDRTGSLTIMSWIRPFAPDMVGRAYRPFSTGSVAGGDGGWGFALRFGDLAGALTTVRFTNYGVADNDSDPFFVTFGEWIHIAATYSNGQINYFLNGVQLGGSDTNFFNNEGAPARVTIGAREGGNDFDQTNGFLDGVRIYNEVLTAEQIQAAATASVVPEPSSIALALLGAGCALRRRRGLA